MENSTYYINTPGVLEQFYSSSNKMKAKSNRRMLLSNLESTDKIGRSLPYHTLSSLSSNPPDSMPGGLTGPDKKHILTVEKKKSFI